MKRGWHSKQKLNAAFRALRKLGLIARQNFSCCRGCAESEIATKLGKQIDAGKIDHAQVKGGVFYSRDEAERRDNGWAFNISFWPIDVTGHGDVGGTREEIGGVVVDTLLRFGIKTEWNGDGYELILVVPQDPIGLSGGVVMKATITLNAEEIRAVNRAIEMAIEEQDNSFTEAERSDLERARVSLCKELQMLGRMNR